MAQPDTPITYTKFTEENGKLTRWAYQFLLDMWNKTGGFDSITSVIDQSSLSIALDLASGKAKTFFQSEVSSNYTISGDFDHEIVTCTNSAGTNITITLPKHYEEAEVTVTRGGTGGVTIAGNGTNILGLANQFLPLQHDSANMYGTSTQWALK